MEYESALARVIDDVVEPGAAAVDRDGTYPRAQLEALGEAGILGEGIRQALLRDPTYAPALAAAAEIVP